MHRQRDEDRFPVDYGSLADCLTNGRAAGGERAAPLSLEVDGGIARLTLARASERNALTVDDLRALVALVEQAERLRARAIILRSDVPGSFCAGLSLVELARLHTDPRTRVPFRNAMRGALSALRMTPLPAIALVEGDCVGLGLALATACDIRIAGPRARFAVDAARLGVGYALEDIVRLRSLVGEGQAARLLYSAEPIDAKEAARIGLVEQVDAQAAERLAQSIAANAPGVVASLKHGLEIAAAGRLGDEGHDRGFDAAFGEDECAEGVAAARSDRTPSFPS